MQLQHDSVYTRVLAKFKDSAFIHTYLVKGAAGQKVELLFELPRFCLEFELPADGSLMSRDYAGYRLSRCQQLVSGQHLASGAHAAVPLAASASSSSREHCLLGDFRQYLVLRHPGSTSSTISLGACQVLLPRGTVSITSSTFDRVQVELDKACGAHLKVWVEHTF